MTDLHTFFYTFFEYGIYYLGFLIVGFLIGFVGKKKIIGKYKKKEKKHENTIVELNHQLFYANQENAELKRKV